ncbi:MAG: hypothetical protein WC279_11055 [Sulfurimonas sp.]|jgi:hypothetical protein|uniref:hypothetical protein n=1 Tax=Sulfurimonas sp. TaxID=2022749 RepID=UPI001BBCAF54|nr:hypothetical protein [Sulfurimonas sp.]MDX9756754.1 hypothetical protein [Sulfurimonas sp.]
MKHLKLIVIIFIVLLFLITFFLFDLIQKKDNEIRGALSISYISGFGLKDPCKKEEYLQSQLEKVDNIFFKKPKDSLLIGQIKERVSKSHIECIDNKNERAEEIYYEEKERASQERYQILIEKNQSR